MRRVGEKRRVSLSHDSSVDSFELPSQKKICVRKEATVSFIDWFQGLFLYWSRKLRNMFSQSSKESKPSEPSSCSTSGTTTPSLSIQNNLKTQPAVTSTPCADDSPFRPLLSPLWSRENIDSKVFPVKDSDELQVLTSKHAQEEHQVYTQLLPLLEAPTCSATSKSIFTPRLENIHIRNDLLPVTPHTTKSTEPSRSCKPGVLSPQTRAISSHHYKPMFTAIQPRTFASNQDREIYMAHPKPVRNAKSPPAAKPGSTYGKPSSYWTQWMKDFKHNYKHLQEEHQVVVEIAKTKLQLFQKERMAMEDVRVAKLRNALAHTCLEHEAPSTWDLTQEQMKRVHIAISSGSDQECLSERYRIRITRGDLRTLTGLVWLNDEVINFYFNLISESCREQSGLKLHVFNSFFYSKLSQSGYSGVRRWTKNVDLFQHDLILLPVHLGMHWCLAAIDLKHRQFLYYDSLLGSNTVCLNRLREYLQSESQDKRKIPLDLTGWTCHMPRDIPQQTNSSDCGVFVCMYARHKAFQIPFNFLQEDMSDIRNHMIYEILEQKLIM